MRPNTGVSRAGRGGERWVIGKWIAARSVAIGPTPVTAKRNVLLAGTVAASMGIMIVENVIVRHGLSGRASR